MKQNWRETKIEPDKGKTIQKKKRNKGKEAIKLHYKLGTGLKNYYILLKQKFPLPKTK